MLSGRDAPSLMCDTAPSCGRTNPTSTSTRCTGRPGTTITARARDAIQFRGQQRLLPPRADLVGRRPRLPGLVSYQRVSLAPDPDVVRLLAGPCFAVGVFGRE